VSGVSAQSNSVLHHKVTTPINGIDFGKLSGTDTVLYRADPGPEFLCVDKTYVPHRAIG
jgi:hypothetical protein